jgi:hypothetical protein
MTVRRFVPALFAIAVAALSAPPPLRAHDLWLAPSSFTPALGEPIRLHLVLASSPDRTEILPRSDAGIVRFVAVGPQGDQPVAGLDGRDPAGFLRPSAPGWYTILYESTPSFATLAPETFRAYLLEKGLDTGPRTPPAASGPAQVGSGAPSASAAEPTTEIFRRSIKARIRVGDASAAGSDPGEEKPAGLPFELVLERAGDADDADRADREIVLRLLLDGAPLQGALVDVRRLDDRSIESKGTTGADGRVRIALGPGSWVATSVHLDPSRPATADWESVWASLTFSLE